MIQPGIFKNDIRAIYGQEIDDSGINLLGKAFGTYFLQKNLKKIIVGRDNRVSGPVFEKNFIEGLLATGIDVVNLGTVTTPMIYYSWIDLAAPATVMITASHNPPEFNGLKSAIDKKPLLGGAYQEIRKILESGKFLLGNGTLSKDNIWPHYLAKITGDIKLKKKLKVVIDSGNGTTSKARRQSCSRRRCSAAQRRTACSQ